MPYTGSDVTHWCNLVEPNDAISLLYSLLVGMSYTSVVVLSDAVITGSDAIYTGVVLLSDATVPRVTLVSLSLLQKLLL